LCGKVQRRNAKRSIPTVLTVAGSDSGGGAGIQADLNTFNALGVHGTTAITCLTAQNPARVKAIEPCSVLMLQQQLEAVCEEFEPAAAKTGMLFSTGLIRIAARFFRKHKGIPLVVDPVMISTSGKRLLKQDALDALEQELLPLAALVTPNLAEAEILVRARLRTPEDLRNVFYDGKEELLLTAPFIRGVHTHGTGCTYSAAIAAHLGLGSPLPEAVARAKEFISNSIANSRRVAQHSVLTWRQT
jgi:hydroxymethylpyrimidine/phosphomethylpyrimidine kinase